MKATVLLFVTGLCLLAVCWSVVSIGWPPVGFEASGFVSLACLGLGIFFVITAFALLGAKLYKKVMKGK